MKKIFSAIIILSVIFSISACGSSEPVKIHTVVWDKTPTKGDSTEDYYLIPNSVKGKNKNDFTCKIIVKVSQYGEKSEYDFNLRFYQIEGIGNMILCFEGDNGWGGMVNAVPLLQKIYAKAVNYL